MRFLKFVIPLFIILSVTFSCSTYTPSSEDTQKIEELRSELEQVRSEIILAEQKNNSLSGGLIKVLVTSRIEILKTTESLINQRIHALESGAKISIQVPGSKPDLEIAKQLEQEIESQIFELNASRAEAAKYSGGFISAMKEATVATQEQTIAILRQRYLIAKYGLLAVLPLETAAEESNKSPLTVSSSASTPDISAVSPDICNEIISVKLLRKRYAEQDIQYYIWFDIEFIAKGLDKPARAIKGVLNLQDLFGEPHFRINWSLDDPIKPGETVVEKGAGFEYNQFIDSHKWVRATEINNMTASFTVTNILYQDGTRRDF